MRILQLGAGLMGRAITYDLLKNSAIESVTVVDAEARRLKETEIFIDNVHELRLETKKMDINDRDALKPLMEQADTVVSAVTYNYNYELARLAVQCGCHFCDLGGNNTIVQKELSLDERAFKRQVTVVPDCGLAPGMASILVADGIRRVDEAHTVRIRVGGLPLNPKPPMNYMLVFSVHGLINEYVEPCVKIRDGEIVQVDPMTEVEEIEFPEPFGKLEAFNTSGGTSTLPMTYHGRVRNLDYKTIRYPGHCAQFKLLMDLGLTGTRPIKIDNVTVVPRDVLAQVLTERLTVSGHDCVLVRVDVEGKKDGWPRHVQYEIVDYGEPAARITAMMRMTAYPISIVAQMLSAGKIGQKGAKPQEVCIPADAFIDQLILKGIQIKITEA